uniref:Uncharacterized protein n=1 Tax=Arundo donax TaxID=35708 RepID=A0A0A9GR50_ARUDO
MEEHCWAYKKPKTKKDSA